MISVVIRSKNEEKALEFLLKNLTNRYHEDIDEIIVIDNKSIDNTKQICESYKAKYIPIEHFSYGGSANLAAESAKNDFVVLFSAHCYPVSHDFFKLILQKFQNQNNLAGLRCIHYDRDYKYYIEGVTANHDFNGAGLMFACSAFSKKVWKKFPFKQDIVTYEDKEWTKRVLENGYQIEIIPSIFCYYIKRNRKQKYFRFKNDVVGCYQLFHTNYSFLNEMKLFFSEIINFFTNAFLDLFYIFRRFYFMIRFFINKPKQF